MYITVKTIKRDLGFKGIEIADGLIGFPILTIFTLMFSLSPYKMFAIVFLMVGIFMLLPINVSKKNRMYKVLGLMMNYCFRMKQYTYSKKQLEKERRIQLDEIKRILKY